jgi:hypothetical protein
MDRTLRFKYRRRVPRTFPLLSLLLVVIASSDCSPTFEDVS